MNSRISSSLFNNGTAPFIEVSKIGKATTFSSSNRSPNYKEYHVEHGDVLEFRIGAYHAREVANNAYVRDFTCQVHKAQHHIQPVSVIWTLPDFTHSIDSVALRASTLFETTLLGEIILDEDGNKKPFPNGDIIFTKEKLILSYRNPGGLLCAYITFRLRIDYVEDG